MKRLTFLIVSLFGMLVGIRAQESAEPATAACPVTSVERTMLFGVGRERLQDTYLSPLHFGGPSVSLTMLTERPTHWGRGRVDVLARYDVLAASTESSSGTTDIWDVQGTASAGLLWHVGGDRLSSRHLRLRLGGLAELTGGGSWHSANGNNPGQARLAADLAFAADLTYTFRVRRSHWQARALLTMPIVGAAFSQQYGESYYELFDLGHRDHNVRPTWPGNSPSPRLLATLSIPVRHSQFTLGYNLDVRQSRLNHLTRHAWSQQFVIGFTRRLCLLPASHGRN